jgi:hypothetical protein
LENAYELISGEDLEECNHGLLEGTIPKFLWGEEGKL